MKPANFSYERPTTLDAALDLLANDSQDSKIIAGGQSLVPPFDELAAWPFGHIYTAFVDIKNREAPLHEHWNSIESVELLMQYNVTPFAERIIETPVMVTLAAGDNITSADLEVAAFNAIPCPNKQLVSVAGVTHMSLYTSEEDLAKVGRAQSGWLRQVLDGMD